MDPVRDVPSAEHYRSRARRQAGTPAPQADGLLDEIGSRVRALREGRGLTLSALARRAKVGKATLSGLEHGTRNATLETCYAIAGVLEVPIAALLGPVGEREPQIAGASVTARLLEVFEDASATTELFHLRIAPGRTQRSPAHGPGVWEVITVFRGTALVGDPDAPSQVLAGSHLRFAADREHLYATATSEAVEASLVIRSPRRPAAGRAGTPPEDQRRRRPHLRGT